MKPITRLFDFAYYQLETHNLESALITKRTEIGLTHLQKNTSIKPMRLVELC